MKPRDRQFRQSSVPWFCSPLLIILLMLAGQRVNAAENRLWLASQSEGRTGFFVDFENSSQSTVCPLRSLKMILGVGDGTQWRFLTTPPGQDWKYDHDYKVQAEITPKGASLLLDGIPTALASGDWKPQVGDLLANSMPSWAHDPADYFVVQKSLVITNHGGQPLSLSFARSAALPPSLMLFEPQAPRRAAGWQVGPLRTLMITAVFRIVRPPESLHALAPFLDRYGQAAAAEWPDKVRQDADLRAATLREQRTLHKWERSNPGAQGGALTAGWHEKATGFYQIVRHRGTWWFLTPKGEPVFYTGLDTSPALDWDKTPITGREYLFTSLPPKTGLTAAAWGKDPWGQDPGADYLALHTVNMLRKYGPQWKQREQALTLQRLRAWGFSGLGKWASPLTGMPDLPVLNRAGVPTLAGHPDIFDPTVQTALVAALRTQIKPRRYDPNVVGWSIGNEYDEIVTTAQVQQILQMTTAVPAKQALTDYLIDTLYSGAVAEVSHAVHSSAQTRADLYTADLHPSETDVERLRQFYADRYYDCLYKMVKGIDPDHLYLGFWISIGWWQNENDWRLISRHCDVIGYDRYAFSFADAAFSTLIREAGKPVLCGEFSFPVQYDGTRGYGAYTPWAQSEAQARGYYHQWLHAAAADPCCIGCCWFQYRDEPLTGRGPGHGDALVLGEHFAFGLVDVTDRPKLELVAPVRDTNLEVAAWHLKAVRTLPTDGK